MLTHRQRRFARHALGLPNQGGTSYRNRFIANTDNLTPGAPFYPWQKMVDLGFAEREADAHDSQVLFWLTLTGARAALDPGERLCPEDFPEDLAAPAPAQEGAAISMLYTNHRGETATRTIRPLALRFGVTQWHPAPGWILRARDLVKMQDREFALADCNFAPAPCTCHPDDTPPRPCPRRYALSECREAAPAPAPARPDGIREDGFDAAFAGAPESEHPYHDAHLIRDRAAWLAGYAEGLIAKIDFDAKRSDQEAAE